MNQDKMKCPICDQYIAKELTKEIQCSTVCKLIHIFDLLFLNFFLGQFNGPSGIAVDSSSGHVFVTDRGNKRIQVFTKDGQFVRVINLRGPISEP